MSIEITNAVSRFFASVDRLDWEAVCELMTNPFHVDYSSLSGDGPTDVSPVALTESWAGFMPGYDQVHHQIGNVIVEQTEDTAAVLCHGTATHFIAGVPEGDLQFVVGTYDIGLVHASDGWKLSSLRFNFKYASGNTNLPALAVERIAARKHQS